MIFLFTFPFYYFFFFFQAEDGIRDIGVTGVQSVLFRSCQRQRQRRRFNTVVKIIVPPRKTPRHLDDTIRIRPRPRSEERRVGKECRSRWSPYDEKKKRMNKKKSKRIGYKTQRDDNSISQ